MIGAASAADWLLPPGSRNALNQPVNEAHPTDRPPGRLTATQRDAGHDPAVLRALEPNHCSTTRDSNAPSTANDWPRSQHPDQPEQGPQPRRPAQGAVTATLPQRMSPDPLDRV
jgi:hypothetical protein